VSILEAKPSCAKRSSAASRKIVVTHPLASFVAYTLDDMKEMLDLGATWLEHVYNDTTGKFGHRSRSRICTTRSRRLAPEHCICHATPASGSIPCRFSRWGIYIKDMLNLG